MHFSTNGPLPSLNCSEEEFRNIVVSVLCHSSDTLNFSMFLNQFSTKVVRDGIGFIQKPSTKYEGIICIKDQDIVREIIWDLIVERYLSVGANGHHEWPSFSVTKRGRAYFTETLNVPFQ